MNSECTSWVPGSRVDVDISSVEKLCNLVGGNCHICKIRIYVQEIRFALTFIERSFLVSKQYFNP